MRRFLLLVLAPALVTCTGVIQMAQGARDTRRNDRLERVSEVLATGLREDLATAWGFLELEAGPVPNADTTISAVRSALRGDTIRALSAAGEGPLASVLFLRNDTLRTASGTFRSPILERVPAVTPHQVGLYLQGVRVIPQPLSPEMGGMPDSLVTTAGWNDREGVWVTSVASTVLGQEGNRVALALRDASRVRPVASARTLAAAVLLLILALMSGWKGLRGPSGSSGAVIFSVLLLTGMTLVISGWVALGESRVASADEVREASTTAALALERSRTGQSEELEGLTGEDVGGEARTEDASPPPLVLISLFGSLLVALGSLVVARRALEADPDQPLGLSG